jgi:hypothetical protein
MLPNRKTHRFEWLVRFVAEKEGSLFVKFVDIFVPDSMLLFCMNLLDRRISPKVINITIHEIDKYVPSKVRSSLIEASNRYIPDTAASSRKVSTIVAGVGKYIPDRIVPEESLDNWSYLKIKFHIPTLLSRRQSYSSRK